MRLRPYLQKTFLNVWQSRGWVARALYPLSLITRAARALQDWRYRVGLATAQRLPVPVVVVGNLYVGGTGKTPLVLALISELHARGYRPGVVSRGYGATDTTARLVDPKGSAAQSGDEPLLIAQKTQVPVAVGRDRVAAARLLLNLHPECNLLIADDGLQHPRLARDVELALVHSQGLGNGWLLPAGPLRDVPERLKRVDAVVFHGRSEDIPVVRVHSPFFRMLTQPGEVYALKDPQRRITLGELAQEQSLSNTRLIAAAGIGSPERFFTTLRTAGLRFESLPLDDHHAFDRNPLAGHDYDCALITEKDAVKCRALPELAADGRLCVVTQDITLDPGLIDFIIGRLRTQPPLPTAAQPTAPHGFPTARHSGLSPDQGAPAV